MAAQFFSLEARCKCYQNSTALQAASPAVTSELKRCGSYASCFQRGKKRKNADGKWVSYCVPCESWTVNACA